MINSLNESLTSKSKNNIEFYRCNLPTVRHAKLLTFFRHLRNKPLEFDRGTLDDQSDQLSYGEADVVSQYDPFEFEWNLEVDTSVYVGSQSKKELNQSPIGHNHSRSSVYTHSQLRSTISWHKTKTTKRKVAKIRKRTRKNQKNVHWTRNASKNIPIAKFENQLPVPFNDSFEEREESRKVRQSVECSGISGTLKTGLMIQELIRNNLREIREFFNLDFNQPIRTFNFVQLASQLNTPKFLSFVQVPICPVDVYRAFCKSKQIGQIKSLQKVVAWTPSETELLLSLVEQFGFGNWKQVSMFLCPKTGVDCRKEFQRVKQVRNWSVVDDSKLMFGVIAFNYRWNEIASLIFEHSKLETQCRERFANILDPQLSQKVFSKQEVFLLVYYRVLGQGWAWICKNVLPFRTDNRLLRKYRYVKRTSPAFLAEMKALVAKIENSDGGDLFKVQRK